MLPKFSLIKHPFPPQLSKVVQNASKTSLKYHTFGGQGEWLVDLVDNSSNSNVAL